MAAPCTRIEASGRNLRRVVQRALLHARSFRPPAPVRSHLRPLMALSWKPTFQKSALLAAALILHRMLRSRATNAMRAPDPAEVGRILVVELWNIGDVILLMPFLSQL